MPRPATRDPRPATRDPRRRPATRAGDPRPAPGDPRPATRDPCKARKGGAVPAGPVYGRVITLRVAAKRAFGRISTLVWRARTGCGGAGHARAAPRLPAPWLPAPRLPPAGSRPRSVSLAPSSVTTTHRDTEATRQPPPVLRAQGAGDDGPRR